jgi:hypothetical protein
MQMRRKHIEQLTALFTFPRLSDFRHNHTLAHQTLVRLAIVPETLGFRLNDRVPRVDQDTRGYPKDVGIQDMTSLGKANGQHTRVNHSNGGWDRQFIEDHHVELTVLPFHCPDYRGNSLGSLLLTVDPEGLRDAQHNVPVQNAKVHFFTLT